jgi:DNA repair exonuclease SbcCD ATPase subunit
MISKDRIFKRGDVIVSGLGNVRVFTGECYTGSDVCYKALAPYCESDCPAGTDMRYARHATKREKKRFFQVLEANGLKYDAKTCTVKAGEEYTPEDTENYTVNRYNGEAMPFKVVKKRVRPTLSQIRILESKVSMLDEVINTHVKEKKELAEHLEDVKGCNEKLAKELKNLKEAHRQTLICEKNLSKKLEDVQHAKELADKDLEAANKDCNRLEESCKKLTDKNNVLEQSNKLMEAELNLQKGRVSELAQSDKESKEYIDYLLGRGFFARLFNLK